MYKSQQKCQAAEGGLVDQESTNKKGVEHKGLKVSRELLIKIRECFVRSLIDLNRYILVRKVLS